MQPRNPSRNRNTLEVEVVVLNAVFPGPQNTKSAHFFAFAFDLQITDLFEDKIMDHLPGRCGGYQDVTGFGHLLHALSKVYGVAHNRKLLVVFFLPRSPHKPGPS